MTIKAGSTTLASGKVDANGNLATSYHARSHTTLTASFTGDAWYAPAQASTAVC